MRLSENRCMQCGSPVQSPLFASTPDINGPYSLLDTHGTVSGTRFWVCSTQCFDRVLAPYIDEDYRETYSSFAEYAAANEPYQDLARSIYDEEYDTPEQAESAGAVLDRFRDEMRGAYTHYQGARDVAVIQAKWALYDRLSAEESILQEQEHRKWAEQEAKLREVEERERLKLEEQERKQREKEEAEEEKQRLLEQQLAEEERMADELPHQIDPQAWFRHTLLLAQTGAGKSNAIAWRIANIIDEVADGKASLILLEPQGELTQDVLWHDIITHMMDRVTIIDPAENLVSVNLFDDVKTPQELHEAIERVNRVLGTIMLDMTPFQRETLTFSMRAMYAQGNPSMRSLLTILRQGRAGLVLDKIPTAVADFFAHDFKDSDARYVISRLNGLLANPIFENLFGKDYTTFDMADEMQEGRLIVIKAANAPHLYGRFWIEEVARSIRSRMAIPSEKRMPTHFIIDEAQNYIAEDLHFAEILDRARAARIAMLVAFHHMGQIKNDHVRNSLYTNTGLKFVARTSADIHNLCRSMGTTAPDFINTLKQYEFGFFGPNMQQAARVRLPLMEWKAGRMDEGWQNVVLRMNRSRLYDKQPRRTPTPLPLPIIPPTSPPPSQKRPEKDGHW